MSLSIGPLAVSMLKWLTGYKALTNNKAANDLVDGVADINADSLVELVKSTDIEYICVVDRSLTMHASTTDVLKYINALLGAWTISAASISTNVGDIKVVKLLDRINPNKSPSYAVANAVLGGAASFASIDADDVALMYQTTPQSLPKTVTSMEAAYRNPNNLPKGGKAYGRGRQNGNSGNGNGNGGGNGGNNNGGPHNTNGGNTPPNQNNNGSNNGNVVDPKEQIADERFTSFSTRVNNDLATVQNLSMGQMITLNVGDGKASKEITISVRVVAIPTEQRLLNTILSWSQKDLRLKSRLRGWRTGELRFWRDVVVMRDVFTERQRILMNDKSDLLVSMLGRSRDSMINSVLTATPSVGTVSTVMVISSDTLRQIERTELDGRIDNYRFRQQIFNTTGIMILAVVDPLSELVTVYIHTKTQRREFSIGQLKAAGKNSTTELTEILKLFNQQSSSGAF